MIPRRMKRTARTFLCFASLVTVARAGAQTQSQEAEPSPSQDHPLLKLDLRRYGFKPYMSGRRDILSLNFTDDSHLVFAWTTLDYPHADKRKGPRDPVPSHLHALVVDARSGQKQNIREWPSTSYFASIHPVGRGRFLACTGSAVHLLSSEFEVIRELSFTDPHACANPKFSPSGRSFFIADGPGLDSQGTLMDSETLAPLAGSTAEGRILTFTDTLLVGTCGPNLEPCIRKLDQTWEPFDLAGPGHQIKDSRQRRFFFVNDSMLLVGTAREMAVLTLEGTILFRVNLPNKLFVGTQVTSTGGERFCILEMKLRGLRSEPLDMYPIASDDQLVVYSVSERRAIYTLKVKGMSPWPTWRQHEHSNVLALSPDGSLLALVDDGILKVYQLPAAKL